MKAKRFGNAGELHVAGFDPERVPRLLRAWFIAIGPADLIWRVHTRAGGGLVGCEGATGRVCWEGG